MAKKVSGLNVSLEGDSASIVEATKKGQKAVAEYSEEVVKQGKKAAAGMKQSSAEVTGLMGKMAGFAKGGGGGIAGAMLGVVGGPTGIVAAAGAVAAVGAAFVALKAAIAGVTAAVRVALDIGSRLAGKMMELVPQVKATGLLAGRMGVDPASLVAVRELFGDVGMEAGQADAAIQQLVTNLGAAGMGLKKPQALFQGLGLDFKKLAQMNTADAFGVVIARIAQIPTAAGRAAASLKMFGMDLQSVMALGPAAMQEALAGASEMGQTYTAAQAEMVNQMEVALDGLGDAWEGLATQVLVRVAPYITAAAQQITDWIAGDGGMTAKVKAGFDFMIKSMLPFVDWIGKDLPLAVLGGVQKVVSAGQVLGSIFNGFSKTIQTLLPIQLLGRIGEAMKSYTVMVWSWISKVAAKGRDMAIGALNQVIDVLNRVAGTKFEKFELTKDMAGTVDTSSLDVVQAKVTDMMQSIQGAAPLSETIKAWGSGLAASAEADAAKALEAQKAALGGGAAFELPDATAKAGKQVKDSLKAVGEATAEGAKGWKDYGQAATEAAKEQSEAQREIGKGGVGSLALVASVVPTSPNTGEAKPSNNITPVAITPVTTMAVGGGVQASVPAATRGSVGPGVDKTDTVIALLKQILTATQQNRPSLQRV